ncbi:hypothetical protein [Agrilutibacter solisilvae]|uniref:Uncharacterized protein n=1 Tax=Agrilutibacter solisilvae TaxID=2763317 RepID=A0A974XY02_9GAMM|nr:hypothetical protein [Lysobacter solisilvae]QSX77804.1 hypothetical protein I8J32_013885 [Lysobacter solisilvae]
MKFTEHVELSDWNGQCLLTVRDVELHDFLDDFFAGHGIEAQVVRPPNNPEQHQLLFPPAISTAAVYRLLSQVGLEEIDRIVRINSGASGAKGGA